MAGTTIASYYAIRKLASSGYDSIDQIILTSATALTRSHKKVFGLLYHCHTIPKVVARLPELGHREVREKTVQKYMREAKNEIIKLIREDKGILEEIKETLRTEYEKEPND